jgi:hypothetical protein
VYALACQADPAVTPERFWSAATKTARTTPYGLMLDPVALIDSLAPQR